MDYEHAQCSYVYVRYGNVHVFHTRLVLDVEYEFYVIFNRHSYIYLYIFFASVCATSEEVTCSQKAHSDANSAHGATFELHWRCLRDAAPIDHWIRGYMETGLAQ